MNVEEIYYKYNTELRNLIILLEVRLNKFPIGVLNEIRSVNDHISRVYLKDDSVDKKKEIELSLRHVERAKLDCYKALLINGEKKVDDFLKNYRLVNLGAVDSGKFYPEYNRRLNKAQNNVIEAKLSEGKGNSHRPKTIELFQEAFLEYEDLDKFIRENSEKLTWSSCYQKKQFWKRNIAAFIISIIAGIVVGLILKIFIPIG